MASALDFAHPATRSWFAGAFDAPTRAQVLAWPSIAHGESTLLLAPTGSGKTLAAFLVSLDRLLFKTDPDEPVLTRVLYVSPLKALGVDVERNLRAPLAGLVARAAADGLTRRAPTVGVRSGDTLAGERERLRRRPPDILITTPESLYLMLGSRVRETLAHVETVIVDEIHALSGGKRGAHLMVSLERLEALRRRPRPLQRIGLSATQRPLEEVARLLGGFEGRDDGQRIPRPVTIVDAGRNKRFDVRVEVPVENMGELRVDPVSEPGPGGASVDAPLAEPPREVGLGLGEESLEGGSGSHPDGERTRPTPSIWPALYQRVLELVRGHHCTLIFVNSRQAAERLAAKLNEAAGEPIALAHHGSVAKDRRAQIEDQLKRGQLPALVATGSLELGIDMGAIDLVVQIEAPLSVASTLQRIGRAGHQVGQVSRGVLFPKFRGDLVACAAALEQALAGYVEATHYPRNPLDVLAQQLVSMVVAESLAVDEAFAIVTGAAPFFHLPRSLFEGVLDMLSGRYPSERFRELRARITWDRVAGRLEARPGARLLASANPGTIVDRGLYGVFLAGVSPAVRVGELDEEMVFESRPGDVILLGASAWRVEEITHDRVQVTHAPGQAARMPFWHGSRPSRPLDFGKAIGALCRQLEEASDGAALERLGARNRLSEAAAQNLLAYVREQSAASRVPTDCRVVVESFVDEAGDWKVLVLSAFGGRVHAPWALLVCARLRQRFGYDVDSAWLDDGMVFRLPQADTAPDPGWFLPEPDECNEALRAELIGSSLFAAYFRENAARALLLPRRRPGRRLPLWLQRRRSADLLSVAMEFEEFPIVLETYRECLSDVFDLEGLRGVLRGIQECSVQVESVCCDAASPFGASLLFSFVGNFIYSTDAPPAERRAQTLSLDFEQLKLLLGEPELREVLDPQAIEQLSRELARLVDPPPLRGASDLHMLLSELGDLSESELGARLAAAELETSTLERWLAELGRKGLVVRLSIHNQQRWIAAQDAARFRDGLGVALPPGVVRDYREPVAEPLLDLVLRFARNRGPFAARAFAERYGLPVETVEPLLALWAKRGQLVQGAFVPGGVGQEYCHAGVLRRLRRRSLELSQKQIEPVPPRALTRLVLDQQHVSLPLSGLDGLLTVVEQLQGCSLPLNALLREILPARIADFQLSDLDGLCAEGEVTWQGAGAGAGDPKIALYLADDFARLAPEVEPAPGQLASRLRELLAQRGGLFFSELCSHLSCFPDELFGQLWAMVWAGEVTNDTLAPLHALSALRGPTRSGARGGRSAFRSRRAMRPGTQGRWSRLALGEPPSSAERARASAERLLFRYGVLCREAVRASGVVGGFAGLYPVLRALEDRGRVRRGYFVAGLGAAQFSLPGLEARLRAEHRPGAPRPQTLSACDPANPFGAWLPWPEHAAGKPVRVAGAAVSLLEGELFAYLGPQRRKLLLFPTEGLTPGRLRAALAAWAEQLVVQFERGGERAWLVEQVDGWAARAEAQATDSRGQRCIQALCAAGFMPTARGLQITRASLAAAHAARGRGSSAG